jgi:hypothetical protein
MDPVIKEIILDKNSKPEDLSDILLEFDGETVDPVIEVIDSEIGDEIGEVLDIFDWMVDVSRNRRMLDSIEFRTDWWIIHKKLRRMVRKNELEERKIKRAQEKEKKLKQSEGWQAMAPYVQSKLDNRTIDQKIEIANAWRDSMKNIRLTSHPSFDLSDDPFSKK